MKYKVGDKVVVIKDIDKHPKANSYGLMGVWANKIMTISYVNSEAYFMKEDNGEWFWYESMFEEFDYSDFDNFWSYYYSRYNLSELEDIYRTLEKQPKNKIVLSQMSEIDKLINKKRKVV